MPAGTPGPVGSICNISTGGWPAGFSQSQCWALWNSTTGTTAQVDKIYADNANTQINSAIDLGMQVVMCYNPRYDTVANMTADLASFTTSVNNLRSRGMTGHVLLHQEVEDHLTAAQFVSLMRFDPNATGIGGWHYAANQAGFQLWWDAAGSHPAQWANYFPGRKYLDGI